MIGNLANATLAQHSNAAYMRISRIHESMSFHDPNSELSLLNRFAHERPIRVSKDLSNVLRFALELSAASDGDFDVSIGSTMVKQGLLPDHDGRKFSYGSWRDIDIEGPYVSFHRPLLLDLGGIAKGYAVDQAVKAIPEEVDITVNAGGDMYMRPWSNRTFAVRNSLGKPASRFITELPMQNAAVATSSWVCSSAPRSPIIGKRESQLARGAMCSVFAADCMTADASTKLCALAPRGEHDDLLQSLGTHVLWYESHGLA